MVRHWWKLPLGIAFTALLLLGFDRCKMTAWVGGTDLEIEFIIYAADTQQPIPEARINIVSEFGVNEHRNEQTFVLITNADGAAHQICHDSMCSGTSSGLGITNTFSVPLPDWRVQISAHGFESSEWTFLYEFETRPRAHRVGPGKAKLVLRVPLRKKQN